MEDHNYNLPKLFEECLTTSETLNFYDEHSFVKYKIKDFPDSDDSDENPDYVILHIVNELPSTSEESVEPIIVREENVCPAASDNNKRKRRMTDSDKYHKMMKIKEIKKQKQANKHPVIIKSCTESGESVIVGEENIYPAASDNNKRKRMMTDSDKYHKMMKMKEIKKQKQANKHPVIIKSCTDTCGASH